MPSFQFEARNPEGQIVTGTMAAENQNKAERILWQNKLVVVSLEPKKEVFGFLENILQGVSIRDKMLFCKQLATMMEAGFPVMQSLNIIALQTTSKKMKEVVAGIITDLEEGHNLSSAIAKYSEVFSKVFISAVKAGEASGKLVQVLRNLSDNLDKDYEFNSKIKGAVVYPIFIVVAMVAIGALMLVKVVPQLETIFKESNVALPWPTRVILGTSHFLISYWWIVIIVIIGAILLIRSWSKTPSGRYQIDLLKIRIPILSRLINVVYMARFCRTFALLVSTGIPILNAIKIVSDVMSNSVFQEVLDKSYQQVEKGVPLSVPLSRSKYFPAMVSHMVGVGEKTGKLDEVLQSLSNYYDLETDSEMKKLSSLLEPILIVIIGIGVAIMVFAIIMPIYSLAQLI